MNTDNAAPIVTVATITKSIICFFIRFHLSSCPACPVISRPHVERANVVVIVAADKQHANNTPHVVRGLPGAWIGSWFDGGVIGAAVVGVPRRLRWVVHFGLHLLQPGRAGYPLENQAAQALRLLTTMPD